MHLLRIKDTPSAFSCITGCTGYCSSQSSLVFRSDHPFSLSRSVRPTSSSTVRTPSFAMYSRSCCAIKRHEVYDIFRFSAKALAQLRILGCDTHRTGIQVADTHHDTAHGYQRSSCKAELLCSQNALRSPHPCRSSAYRLSR